MSEGDGGSGMDDMVNVVCVDACSDSGWDGSMTSVWSLGRGGCHAMYMRSSMHDSFHPFVTRVVSGSAIRLVLDL